MTRTKKILLGLLTGAIAAYDIWTGAFDYVVVKLRGIGDLPFDTIAIKRDVEPQTYWLCVSVLIAVAVVCLVTGVLHHDPRGGPTWPIDDHRFKGA